MADIVQRDNPILRATAKAVDVKDIGSERIKSVISDMQKAMNSQKDGIAIAAPQIGVSLRIFVISGHLLKLADKSYKGDESDLIFINPKIIKLSRNKNLVEEGCLSVRWYFGSIKRSDKATITAYNEKGEFIERGASGLLAQIFQHETDHLEGTLFIDHAKELWEMNDEEIAAAQGK